MYDVIHYSRCSDQQDKESESKNCETKEVMGKIHEFLWKPKFFENLNTVSFHLR